MTRTIRPMSGYEVLSDEIVESGSESAHYYGILWPGWPHVVSSHKVRYRRLRPDGIVRLIWKEGTGGQLIHAGDRFVLDGTRCFSDFTEKTQSGTRDRFLSTSQLLAFIRSVLSLNVTELAQALGVERPTIYSWLREASTPREANRDRLQALYRVARMWAQSYALPLGRLVREPLLDGDSLLSQLSEPQLDHARLRGSIRRLAALAEDKVLETAGRRVGRWPGALESAREHGLDPTQLKRQENVVDWITGKRSSLED